jgi:hypothetical protein
MLLGWRAGTETSRTRRRRGLVAVDHHGELWAVRGGQGPAGGIPARNLSASSKATAPALRSTAIVLQ